MAKRLTLYKVPGATIHFTADDPLPADTIEEFVRKRFDESLDGRDKA